tara:strand:- start:109 stop:726 length:618 start_codon:yes stop_codon:yes gene_type:complete
MDFDRHYFENLVINCFRDLMTYFYINLSSFRLLCLLQFAALVSACSVNNLEDWPHDLPAVESFVAAYDADPVNQQHQELGVYLYWVTAFYQGNIAYPTGWNDVERIILQETGDEEDEDFSEKLLDVGISIASEWSKDNPIRKIDNRMLSMWASILQIALADEKHRQAVDLIAEDIDALFSGDVDAANLNDSHYESLLGLELFGGF